MNSRKLDMEKQEGHSFAFQLLLDVPDTDVWSRISPGLIHLGALNGP